MRTLPVESASEATAPHQPSNVRQRYRAFQGAPKPWTNLFASRLSIPRWNDLHLMRVEAEAQRGRKHEKKDKRKWRTLSVSLPTTFVLWPNCLRAWFRFLAALCDGDNFWKLLEALLVCKTQKGQWLSARVCVCVSLFAKSWLDRIGWVSYLARKEKRNTSS